MKPFKLEAKHMVNIKETAFAKDASTRLMHDLIKNPETVVTALDTTSLRFSLMPQERRAIRLG
jgi:hypothetical protein